MSVFQKYWSSQLKCIYFLHSWTKGNIRGYTFWEKKNEQKNIILCFYICFTFTLTFSLKAVQINNHVNNCAKTNVVTPIYLNRIKIYGTVWMCNLQQLSLESLNPKKSLLAPWLQNLRTWKWNVEKALERQITLERACRGL